MQGELEETHQNLMAVAHGNFDLELDGQEGLSELVIFPSSQIEAGGIEDLRLVRFTDDDDSGALLRDLHGIQPLPTFFHSSPNMTVARCSRCAH